MKKELSSEAMAIVKKMQLQDSLNNELTTANPRTKIKQNIE